MLSAGAEAREWCAREGRGRVPGAREPARRARTHARTQHTYAWAALLATAAGGKHACEVCVRAPTAVARGVAARGFGGGGGDGGGSGVMTALAVDQNKLARARARSWQRRAGAARLVAQKRGGARARSQCSPGGARAAHKNKEWQRRLCANPLVVVMMMSLSLSLSLCAVCPPLGLRKCERVRQQKKRGGGVEVRLQHPLRARARNTPARAHTNSLPVCRRGKKRGSWEEFLLFFG